MCFDRFSTFWYLMPVTVGFMAEYRLVETGGGAVVTGKVVDGGAIAGMGDAYGGA